MLIASYKERYPEDWQIYLEAESEHGFITNALNDHIMAHIEVQVPGLHWKHYRVGTVDFRFANERTFRFRMWQPENRLVRWDDYWSYVGDMHKRHQSVRQNGRAEWTTEQIRILLSYLEENVPEFWGKVCEIYDQIGFSHPSVTLDFQKHAAAVFPLPEDIGYSTIVEGVVEEANGAYQFEMIKPENRTERQLLQQDWMEAEDRMTFDEWRLSLKAGKRQ